MNPVALLAWVAACLACDLLTLNPVQRGAALLAAVTMAAAGSRQGVSRRPLVVSVAVAAILTVVTSTLLSHVGDDVIATVPLWVPGAGGPLTLEAMVYGLDFGLGLAAAVAAVAPLTLALEPQDLVDALPSWLDRTAAAVAASMNLVPGLVRGFVAVRDAQRLRGWKPGGLRAWREVLLPVMLTSMESSIQLAEAMEARAFGSGRRTRMAPPRWQRLDTLTLVLAGAAAVILAAGMLLGLSPEWYPYPALTAPAFSPAGLGAGLLLVIPALAWHWRGSTS